MYILLISFIWAILLTSVINIRASGKLIVFGIMFISCYIISLVIIFIIYFIQNFIGGIIWLILMNLWVLLIDFVIRKM